MRGTEILGLIAEGRSDAGVARTLHISERTVEAACAQLFRKLNLEPSPDTNRRVLAVLDPPSRLRARGGRTCRALGPGWPPLLPGDARTGSAASRGASIRRPPVMRV